MKIAEVRALLAGYSPEQLKLIIAEMYKAIPKKIKEDKGIDAIVKDPDAFVRSKKGKKKPKLPDIFDLQEETETFLENAYAQNYFAPNRVIPKSQRFKWRFIVKRLYKDLIAAASDEKNLPIAARLVEKLYCLLCYACGVILFSCWDPFDSVQVEQPEFFRSLLALKSRNEPAKEFVGNTIRLIVENQVNRYTLPMELMEVALEFFTTPDLKEMAVTACEREIKALKQPQKEGKQAKKRKRNSRRDKASRINELTGMAFLACASLRDFERGVAIINEHYQSPCPEVRLYVLMNLLRSFQQDRYLIEAYERAVRQGVKPREELVRIYENAKAKTDL